MNDRVPLPELSDEQIAQVDKGIEQLGEFLRDVLRRPEIVTEIPSGSTLAFHMLTVTTDQYLVRLTAFRPKDAERWSVRVTGFGDQELEHEFPRTMPELIVSILPLMQTATWESPDDAFADMEEALQQASELHLLAGSLPIRITGNPIHSWRHKDNRRCFLACSLMSPSLMKRALNCSKISRTATVTWSSNPARHS